MKNIILGIDVGGSGIKGNLVNVKKGETIDERIRIETPPNAKPKEIAKIIKEIADKFNYKGIIGCGFPAVIEKSTIKTAANIDKSNIGVNAEELFTKITGRKVFVLNDADAAGIAEMKFGKGKDYKGTTLVLTLGTGIGSALFINNKLVPNTEFGSIYMPNGLIAEKYTSAAVRKRENLLWIEWAERFNEYINYINRIVNPKIIIIGGGISKKFDKYIDKIDLKNKLKPASLLNNAGIIGAALYAKTKK